MSQSQQYALEKVQGPQKVTAARAAAGSIGSARQHNLALCGIEPSSRDTPFTISLSSSSDMPVREATLQPHIVTKVSVFAGGKGNEVRETMICKWKGEAAALLSDIGACKEE